MAAYDGIGFQRCFLEFFELLLYLGDYREFLARFVELRLEGGCQCLGFLPVGKVFLKFDAQLFGSGSGACRGLFCGGRALVGRLHVEAH